MTEQLEKTEVGESDQIHRDRALLLLGGIRAVDRLTQILSGEVMSNLLEFEKQKLFESLGYTRFTDFLEQSEYAPMSKNQFYDRRKIFEIEGEKLFDFLNGIGMPTSKRKLLGRGNIQLEGETIIIIDPATQEEICFDANDKTRILETITALADANADKSKKLDKGREDNDRLKRKLNEVEETLETERLSPNAANHDEIETCYIVIGSTMKRLNELLEDATLVRVSQFEEKSLRVLAAQFQKQNKIIAAKLPGSNPGAVLDDEEENRLASLLDDED